MVSYTAFADYILMNPSAEYEEIMARVHEKIYLSKASHLFVHVLYCYATSQSGLMMTANHQTLSSQVNDLSYQIIDKFTIPYSGFL